MDKTNPLAGGIIANASQFGKVVCEGCKNTAMVSALYVQGDEVIHAGSAEMGYVVGVSTNQVQYSTDKDALFKAGVYLFNCTNTYSDLSYAAIGSANGIAGGLYKIYVKDSEHDEYAKLSDTDGAVYYDGNKFYNKID